MFWLIRAIFSPSTRISAVKVSEAVVRVPFLISIEAPKAPKVPKVTTVIFPTTG
jgi:hypothetical protein